MGQGHQGRGHRARIALQNPYDAFCNGGQVQLFKDQLAARAVAAMLAEGRATQVVRNRILPGARELGGGVADAQKVGCFILNCAKPHPLRPGFLAFHSADSALPVLYHSTRKLSR